MATRREKGLRHHQQIKHKTSYEQSKDLAELASRSQLSTALSADHPIVALNLQQVRATAEAEAARLRAARAALAPGLAAARDGDLEALKALAAEGWDVRTSDRHGSTALHWAAGGGHLPIVRWLVEDCGLDPTATVQPKDGRNALHWACRNGMLPTCRWLVEECGMDPSAPTKDGTSPFHWAVWKGHREVCAWLIEAGADWRAKNSFGCNAVQWAALSGSVEMCRWLQQVGLELGLLNDNGHSALHKCAIYGHGDVIAWLLTDTGCNAAEYMGPDDRGSSPSALAAANGYAQLAAELRDVEDRTLRLPAVYHGN